ncbi:MAG: cell division protein SepF, partial [Clostridia bacterium]|nr:cell division protein SepF [Clostridia bacterium]
VHGFSGNNSYSYNRQPVAPQPALGGYGEDPFAEQRRPAVPERSYGRSRERDNRDNKVVSMYKNTGSSNLIIFKPVSCDDAAYIIDNLKGNRPVIVNFENVDEGIAQRIFDMVGGAVYCMCGTVNTISKMVYVFAPESMDVSGDNGKVSARNGVGNMFMDLSK